jgi:hypothetical protein
MANSDMFPGNMATWGVIGLTVTDGGLDEEQSELVGAEPSIQTSACRQCQNNEERSKQVSGPTTGQVVPAHSLMSWASCCSS